MSYDRTRAANCTPEEWDAALRLSDRYNLHLLALGEGAWWQYIAVRLSDGGGISDLYPSRESAILHQIAPEHHTYVRVVPGGMSPLAAARFLAVSRAIKSRHRTDLHRVEAEPILPARLDLARNVLR